MLNIKHSSEWQISTHPTYRVSGKHSNPVTLPRNEVTAQSNVMRLKGFLQGMDTTFMREADRV